MAYNNNKNKFSILYTRKSFNSIVLSGKGAQCLTSETIGKSYTYCWSQSITAYTI